MTTARLLYCRKCGSGYASIGEIPPRCPACDRVTVWTTVPTVQLRRAMILSPKDRIFLKVNRIGESGL